MSVLRYIPLPLWRVWFYILIGVVTLILSPFLLITLSRTSWYPRFYKVARIWSALILYGMGFFPKITGRHPTEKGKNYLFVSNHTSMTDIMLMYHAVKTPFVFVGKRELAKLPLFGFFYKRSSILVDRSRVRSRKEVFDAARERFRQGLSLCIFPEGGIPSDRSILLDDFKDGAFRMAIDHGLTIAPLVFHDNKKRFSYKFFSGSPGVMRVQKLQLIETKDLAAADKRTLKEKVRGMVLGALEEGF